MSKDNRYRPVQDNPNLVKDMATGAIINNDRNGYAASKKRLEESLKQKQMIEEHDQELSEIKDMLKQILIKLDSERK